MGTRADFYVGKGEDAEYLGSVSWDGYPSGFDTEFWKHIHNEADYRTNVLGVSEERDDWTSAEEGWPWPWNTSATTDYAYTYDPEDGLVYFSIFGRPWRELKSDNEFEDDEEADAYMDEPKNEAFPNMKERRVDHDAMMAKSGLIVINTGGTA